MFVFRQDRICELHTGMEKQPHFLLAVSTHLKFNMSKANSWTSPSNLALSIPCISEGTLCIPKTWQILVKCFLQGLMFSPSPKPTNFILKQLSAHLGYYSNEVSDWLLLFWSISLVSGWFWDLLFVFGVLMIQEDESRCRFIYPAWKLWASWKSWLGSFTNCWKFPANISSNIAFILFFLSHSILSDS